MRIVHLTPVYFPSFGGYQTKIKQLSERLASRGHQVSVVTSVALSPDSFTQPAARQTDLAPGTEMVAGVQVVRLPYQALPAALQYPYDWFMGLCWRYRLWHNESVRNQWVGPNLRGLTTVFDNLRPQVVLAGPLPYTTAYQGLAQAQRLKIPCAIIPCLHQHQEWESENRLHYQLFSQADAFVPNTDYEADWARTMGATPQTVCVLGDGVDPNALSGGDSERFRKKHRIAPNDIVVLFLGRKEEGKGAFHLLNAAAKVWEHNQDVTFVFAGTPTAGWSRAAATFAGSNRVINLDRFAEDDKPDLLAAADIVALPSQVESMGIAYLEGWACSKPVIGCRTGPIQSIVDDGRNGLLVRFGDSDALAQAIGTLAVDPQMRAAFGRSGRQKIGRQYHWNRLTDQLETLYSEQIEAYR